MPTSIDALYPVPAAPDYQVGTGMAQLLAALRAGRTRTLQGEEEFYQGGSQDLAARLGQQNLGSLQNGLASALARQRARRLQDVNIDSGQFARGLDDLASGDRINQIGALAAAHQQLNEITTQGRIAEAQLRAHIQRIRQAQQQSQLLDMLGQVLGVGVTALL